MLAPLMEWTSFFTWWRDTTINWPQALAIILNHRLFLAGIHHKWPGKEQTQLLEEIWCRYHELASLLIQAHVSITEEQWKVEAHELGRLYIKCWGQEEVTPYLHVYIYHISYYLEQYSSKEKLGNYALGEAFMQQADPPAHDKPVQVQQGGSSPAAVTDESVAGTASLQWLSQEGQEGAPAVLLYPKEGWGDVGPFLASKLRAGERHNKPAVEGCCLMHMHLLQDTEDKSQAKGIQTHVVVEHHQHCLLLLQLLPVGTAGMQLL